MGGCHIRGSNVGFDLCVWLPVIYIPVPGSVYKRVVKGGVLRCLDALRGCASKNLRGESTAVYCTLCATPYGDPRVF